MPEVVLSESTPGSPVVFFQVPSDSNLTFMGGIVGVNVGLNVPQPMVPIMLEVAVDSCTFFLG